MTDPKRKGDFEDWVLDGGSWRMLVAYLYTFAFPLVLWIIAIAILIAIGSAFG
ncbi:MAG: hypothetical protein ACF8PN_07215 [Phycisphaerales bacterium]